MNWISMRDQSPELGIPVLFYDVVSDSIAIGELRQDGWFWIRDLKVDANFVTHWAALEKPEMSDDERRRRDWPNRG